MAAQAGDAVILAYANQGVQQAGGAVLLEYAQAATQRRVAGGAQARWTGSALLRDSVTARHPAATDLVRPTAAAWPQGIRLDDGERAAWGVADTLDRNGQSAWGRYERRLHVEPDVLWGVSLPLEARGAVPWGRYERRAHVEPAVPWAVSAPADGRRAAPWGGPLAVLHAQRTAPFDRAPALDVMRWVPWTRFSRVLAPGWGVVIPAPNPNDPPEALYVVPIRRFYMVINSVELRKVDGNVALPAYAFGMSLDVDSWTWSFNASLRKDALPHVRRPAGADPVEIEAVVNGAAYRLRIERIAREANFPATRIRVSGRGLAATLAAPYSPVMSFGNPSAARTAQQLANDVLTVNGVPLGWTVDWQLTDWLVPAGAWAFQGSYIDAINDIARAAGGYVQPHPTAATLRVLPRYPSAPWTWAGAAPDVELPAAVVEVESTEWIDKPEYNRVFVGGVGQGVFGPVTRTGTAGDLVAPQVAHALITAADAQRQRGLAELADTGPQAHLQLKLPVLAESGLILPGQLVRYLGAETTIGIVRRTSLDSSTPIMRQTIGVETHVA